MNKACVADIYFIIRLATLAVAGDDGDTYLRDVAPTIDAEAFSGDPTVEWIPVVSPPLATTDPRVSQALLFHMPRHSTSCMVLDQREEKDIMNGSRKIFTRPNNIGTIYHGLPSHLLGRMVQYAPKNGEPKVGIIALTTEEATTVALYYSTLYHAQAREPRPTTTIE